MKFAISGAQGTGKTTLLNMLKQCDDFKKYFFINSASSQALKEGIIKEGGKNSDEQKQQWIAEKQIEDMQTNKDSFYDRCLWDSYVYTSYLRRQGKISVEFSNWHFGKFLEAYEQFDCIFYLPVEFPLVDNGQRSLDVNFQKEIDQIFREYVDCGLYSNIYTIKGSVEERIEKIKFFCESHCLLKNTY